MLISLLIAGFVVKVLPIIIVLSVVAGIIGCFTVGCKNTAVIFGLLAKILLYLGIFCACLGFLL